MAVPNMVFSDVESFLDSHPELFEDYLNRKGNYGMVEKWLKNHRASKSPAAAAPAAQLALDSVSTAVFHSRAGFSPIVFKTGFVGFSDLRSTSHQRPLNTPIPAVSICGTSQEKLAWLPTMALHSFLVYRGYGLQGFGFGTQRF